MTKVYYSFVYKNPNKILKTFKAKISGRAMITVASRSVFSVVDLMSCVIVAKRPCKTVQVKNRVLLFWQEQKQTKNCWNLF